MGGISPVGGIRNFTGGRVTGWREPEEEWFWWFEPFSMLKTAFHECWTSIKIKINMTCVLKEYKIKTKMEQEQWLQLKCCFYWVITFNYKYIINITINNCCLVGGGELNSCGGESTRVLGGFFQVGGWANFRLVGGAISPIPPSPQYRNPGIFQMLVRLICGIVSYGKLWQVKASFVLLIT